MINYIWGLIIIIGCFFSITIGLVDEINEAINYSLKNGVSTIINMTGTICFWSGITNILINTKLKDKLLVLLNPMIEYIFPNIKGNKRIINKIGINMMFNMLGLGNAATPIGMSVVEELEKEKISNEIREEVFLVILINSVSIQLIPTTVIAIMNNYDSKNIGKIIIPILLNSIVIFGIVITLAKFYIKCRSRYGKNT